MREPDPGVTSPPSGGQEKALLATPASYPDRTIAVIAAPAVEDPQAAQSDPVWPCDAHDDVLGSQTRTAATYSSVRSTGRRWPAPAIG
jgi:hypothetical protein